MTCKTPLPQSHDHPRRAVPGRRLRDPGDHLRRHLRDHNSGLGQGFQDVTGATEHFAGELPMDMTMDWLAGAGRTGKRPFFAWVHLFDPHTPHTPPQPYALGFRPAAAVGPRAGARLDAVPPARPARLRASRCWAATATSMTARWPISTARSAACSDFLESRGMLENTLIVLVADHGESLGEHGILYRHVGLYDTTHPRAADDPLAGPRAQKGGRIHGLVQTIDLFPTLLDAAGLKPPATDGADLRELTGERGKERPARRLRRARRQARR